MRAYARHALPGALLIVCVLVFSAFAVTSPVRAQDEHDAEDLILAVSYPPYTLSNGVLALQQNGQNYLPLIELAEMLEFYVESELERGLVHGYFIEEKNSFFIDAERGEYGAKSEKKSLPSDAVIRDPFGSGYVELFVRDDILNEIWPVKLTVNLGGLVLLLETEEKLPFELKLEREEKREIALSRLSYAQKDKKNLPFVPNPYKALGKPAIDVETENKWQDKDKIFTSRLNVAGVQDLAWATAEYAAGLSYEDGHYQRPKSVRLTLSREAYGDETLGLGIKRAEGGDTRVDQRDLVTNSSSGRGISVSSYPLQSENEFDRITIEGNGLPGWEIELYRNDQLLEFGVVDEKGEYRFESVPLLLGNNQIRLVLYGPQGQVQERIENYQISGGMSKPGETDYTVGFVDNGREFVRLEKPDSNSKVEGIAGNAYVAHGITRSLTAFGSISKLPTDQGEKKYATAGVMASIGKDLAQAEIYKEVSGGHALDLRYATQIMGVRLNMQSAFFRNFESPDAGVRNSAKTFEGELRANTNIPLPFKKSMGLQVNVKQTENKNSLPFTKLDTSQSISFGGLRFTHQTDSSFNDYVHTNSTGKISATVRMKQWQFRSQLDYNIYPDYELSSANADVRYTDKDGFSAAVNAQHSFLTSDYGGGLQFGYDFGKVLSSFDVRWARDQGFEFTLRASSSLGPYGKDGRYIIDSRKLSRATPVQGRVFLDRDGDKKFSEGDEPIQDAGIAIAQHGTGEQTDADGIVTVFNGGTKDIVNIEANRSYLTDPYHVPATEGYSTVPRMGSMPIFDFPIVETGAVDGTVTRENGSPIPGMTLQLINEAGEILQTTESAYDGFYTFEFVPQGTYTVRADPSYEVNVPPETVTVTSDDLFTSGIDLQLLEQAEEVEAAVDVEEGDEPSTAAAAETESGEVAHTHHERSNGTLQPAPLPTEGDLSAFVKRVRIGEHPDKIRLVLDLSGPIVYRSASADGGKTVVIELPGVAWDAIRSWRGNTTPMIESFETQGLPEGGTRLVIHGRGNIALGLNGVLPPQNGQGHRLFIDLQAGK